MSGESEQSVILIRLQREPDVNADPAGRRRVQARRSCGPSSAAQPTPLLRAVVRDGTPVGGRLQAVERTVPFGLIGFSVVTPLVRGARARRRHDQPPGIGPVGYTRKTEPSYDDRAVTLRRVIIAARFAVLALSRSPRTKTRAVPTAWLAAGT
jgi:hypothetical protein